MFVSSARLPPRSLQLIEACEAVLPGKRGTGFRVQCRFDRSGSMCLGGVPAFCSLGGGRGGIVVACWEVIRACRLDASARYRTQGLVGLVSLDPHSFFRSTTCRNNSKLVSKYVSKLDSHSVRQSVSLIFTHSVSQNVVNSCDLSDSRGP